MNNLAPHQNLEYRETFSSNFSVNPYRFGFNGQEKEDEIYGEENAAFANNPILLTDHLVI